MRAADRFSDDAAVYIHDGDKDRRLVPNFAASADPTVSFDGLRILFAGKQHGNDPLQIWEIGIDGSTLRRITTVAEDCVRPLYLPEDRIVYARKIGGRFSIEALAITGGKPLVLTYSPGNFLPNDVLRDGRILFAAGYPLGPDASPELYTVYSDGSGVESYRCDHGTARHSARQNKLGDIVFAAGQTLARFTSARALQLPITAPAGQYAGEVAETGDGVLLLAWRPDSNAFFQVVRWTAAAKDFASILKEPGANVVQPTLLVSRPIPNMHPSGLHDWPNANLLCLNAYTSKYTFAPGSIRTVRVYTRDAANNPKLLGTAPVENDGSFFVQVPTEQPVQIELIDASGKTLKRESGFFWMRRGEQRVCVGCHAGPETAPENAVPKILLKSTTPADMTSAAPTASGGH
jgi:hypothetical protein